MKSEKLNKKFTIWFSSQIRSWELERSGESWTFVGSNSFASIWRSSRSCWSHYLFIERSIKFRKWHNNANWRRIHGINFYIFCIFIRKLFLFILFSSRFMFENWKNKFWETFNSPRGSLHLFQFFVYVEKIDFSIFTYTTIYFEEGMKFFIKCFWHEMERKISSHKKRLEKWKKYEK